jgi:IS30 family transposase
MKLSEGWSPEQISNRLRIEKKVKISTEGIYKFIFSCGRRGEKLHCFLRQYKRGRKRLKKRKRYWEGQPYRRRSIVDRPKNADLRKEQGHWERDLMLGKRSTGGILAVVDRKSHFTLLERLITNQADEVNLKTAESIKKSKLRCLSITNDNGSVFGKFWDLEETLSTKIYFARPLSPWERGTVENTIGLLRQFVKRGADLSTITQADLKELETTINSRPLKGLGFKTPIEVVTGKDQKLIKQRLFAQLPPGYYERFE